MNGVLSHLGGFSSVLQGFDVKLWNGDFFGGVRRFLRYTLVFPGWVGMEGLGRHQDSGSGSRGGDSGV